MQRLDGRLLLNWWLVDNQGQEHLAVTGSQRVAEMGHCDYAAFEPMASLHPFHASNHGDVISWLGKVSVVLGTISPLQWVSMSLLAHA